MIHVAVQISQLLQKQKSEESLGGVPGGERVPAVEGGREKSGNRDSRSVHGTAE